MWILHRASVYANVSMNDAKYSNPESDTAVTSGWSANESLEFDPGPIDTDEQSSNSSLQAANTEARCRSSIFIQTLLSIPKKHVSAKATFNCMTHGRNAT